MDDSEEMWLDKAEEEYLEKKHYNCPKCLGQIHGQLSANHMHSPINKIWPNTMVT